MTLSDGARQQVRWLTRSLCLVVLAAASTVATGQTFNISYTDAAGQGFNDPVYGASRKAAFQQAVSIWQTRLVSPTPVSIDIAASFASLGGTSTSAILGQGGPSTFFKGFAGGSSSIAYPASLANYLSGSNLNGSSSDISITFNSDVDNSTVLGSVNWYYGTDMHPGSNIDFVDVAVHELTHGLGFLDTFTSSGSWGLTFGSNKYPDIYDTFLVNGSGQRLIDRPTSAANVTSPVYWSGPSGMAAYQKALGGQKPPMYAPSTYAAGSSLSHLDEATFTGAYDLMSPIYSALNHSPDAIVRGILNDLGWHIAGLGDANADGQVNVADLLAETNKFGIGFGQAGYSAGLDLNGDGVINLADLQALSAHMGETGVVGNPISIPGAALLANASQLTFLPGMMVTDSITVPEPACGVLLLLAAGNLALRSRRSRC